MAVARNRRRDSLHSNHAIVWKAWLAYNLSAARSSMKAAPQEENNGPVDEEAVQIVYTKSNNGDSLSFFGLNRNDSEFPAILAHRVGKLRQISRYRSFFQKDRTVMFHNHDRSSPQIRSPGMFNHGGAMDDATSMVEGAISNPREPESL